MNFRRITHHTMSMHPWTQDVIIKQTKPRLLGLLIVVACDTTSEIDSILVAGLKAAARWNPLSDGQFRVPINSHQARPASRMFEVAEDDLSKPKMGLANVGLPRTFTAVSNSFVRDVDGPGRDGPQRMPRNAVGRSFV